MGYVQCKQICPGRWRRLLSKRQPTRRDAGVHFWLGLFGGGVAVGACFVGLLVAPRRSTAIALVGMALGSVLAVRSFSGIVKGGTAQEIGLVVCFMVAGIAGGYWTAAAALQHATGRPEIQANDTDPAPGLEKPAIIVLSTAEAPRYRISSTAAMVERLIGTGALHLPVSALPFLFLSEKSRYHAIGDYLPARATAVAVADKLGALTRKSAGTVRVAWCAGAPTLRTVAGQLASEGCRSAVLVVLGPDASFPVLEAESELPSTSGPHITHARSIWRSDALAKRLTDRVIDATNGVALSEVGIMLAGEGQSDAWTSLAGGWAERENYFNQRVKLMLTERGVGPENVRIGWIEWQSPDVTETVRHLAALGCKRIVIAPSTLPHITLASALDLKHAIASARLAEDVRVVTLTPWGDDDAIVSARAEAALEALAELRT